MHIMKFPVLALPFVMLTGLSQRADATFVVAYHDFEAGGGVESPDFNNSPLVLPLGGPPLVEELGGDLTKIPAANALGVDTGGSDDKTLGSGNADFLWLAPPGTNNGFVSLFKSTAAGTVVQLIVELTNNSLSTMFYLQQISFDAIRQSAGANPSLNVGWRYQGGGGFTTIGNTGAIGDSGQGNDWNDFDYSPNIPFAPGETIEIQFLGMNGALNGISMDNIGFAVVPEPGNVIGLGALLASAFMVRHRRRGGLKLCKA